jgi:hypothetical protein
MEEAVIGTTSEPTPRPGLTVDYWVRAAGRHLWSNLVSVSYPASAGEAAGVQARERARREAAQRAEGEARERSARAAAVARETAEREAREREAKERGQREAGEREARERTEREARERVEREAKEREAREHKEHESSKERKEREAKEKSDREKHEREAKERAEREKHEREARERTEREARERKEREAREKAEREGKEGEREKHEREARERAEREAREKAEREAREKAEHEARERAEREAKEKTEREVAEREARERAEREAREGAEREAREKTEREAKEHEKPLNGGTFTPTILPRSGPEIPNTGRGLYDWQGGTSGLPSGWPTMDYYMRDAIVWSRDLEPSQGHYPFLERPGVIDEGLGLAAEKGGRLRFRIMAWMPGSTNRMPSYIETESYGGQTFPKWNSASWLNAWANLWKALGTKYGSNPRVGWVDVGGYGAWGEAHMDGLGGTGTHITTENFLKMVGDVVAAFPKAHVVLGTSAAVKNEAPIQPQLLPAVIRAYPTVGFHFDNIGASAPSNGNNLPYLKLGGAAEDLEAWERWKTAPVISEWWNLPNATVAMARASTQEMHVSGIGSGNIQSSVHSGHEGEYQELLKLAGFRDQLDQVEVSALAAGQPASFAATWENVNVAPTYDPWEVRYELRSGEGVVWSSTSSFDLRRLLPTEGKPMRSSDTFTLPSGLPKGSYTLAVQVVDPTGTVAPMRLADAGRTADGAYPLGAVTVG